jgi:3-dehydroquinate synthase
MQDKSQLTVDLGDRSYPIYIESGLLKRIGEIFISHKIPTSSPILLVTDENVAPLYLESTLLVLQKSGYKVGSIVVPAGEKTKSLEMLDRIVEQALLDGLDRKSTIVALGGGVVWQVLLLLVSCVVFVSYKYQRQFLLMIVA